MLRVHKNPGTNINLLAYYITYNIYFIQPCIVGL